MPAPEVALGVAVLVMCTTIVLVAETSSMATGVETLNPTYPPVPGIIVMFVEPEEAIDPPFGALLR